MAVKTISSQRYTDPVIVQAKRDSGDYVAQFVRVTVDGVEYNVVVDGHHSVAAAKADGVDVEWELAHDMLQREAARDGAPFLEQHHGGDDYYDIDTGLTIW